MAFGFGVFWGFGFFFLFECITSLQMDMLVELVNLELQSE